MTSIVTWNRSVPAEVRASAQPLIAKWLHLAPTTAHEIRAFWDDSCEEAMRVRFTHEYRFAQVTFGPSWLSGTDEDRAQAVRHEMLHLPLMPVVSWTRDLIRDLVERDDDDPRLAAFLQREFNERVEACICDLERAVARG